MNTLKAEMREYFSHNLRNPLPPETFLDGNGFPKDNNERKFRTYNLSQ